MKVKRFIAQNKIPLLSGKRKYDCIRSGSRQFDNATKRMAVWKPSVESGPIPVSVRPDGKNYFTWITSVGEATMGDVTMVSPDNQQTGTGALVLVLMTTGAPVVCPNTVYWHLIPSQSLFLTSITPTACL